MYNTLGTGLPARTLATQEVESLSASSRKKLRL